MDAMTCITTRRSNRRYLPDAVPKEVLEKIVEAGRCAPSGGNNQSFHFIVVTNQEVLKTMADMVQSEFEKMELKEDMYSSLKGSIRAAHKGGYVFHYHAPAFIIVANKKGYGNAMADSACALENMMLAANALDLGSCWINQLHWLDSYCGMTGEHPKMDAYMRELGVAEDETVCGCLSIGYVEKLNRDEMTRKSVVTYVD